MSQSAIESESVATRPKRRNTTTACHICRRRKVRCDGRTPCCHQCMKAGVECSYERESDHRKAPTWKHVRALEARMRMLEEQFAPHSGPISPSAISEKKGGSSGTIDLLDGVRSESDQSTIGLKQTAHLSRNHLGDIRYFGSSSPYHHLPSDEYQPIINPLNLTVNPSAGIHRFLPSTMAITLAEHERALDIFFTHLASPLIPLSLSDFTTDMNKILNNTSTDAPSRSAHYSPMLHNLILATAWRLVRPGDEGEKGAEELVDYALRWFHVEIDRATLCTIASLCVLANYYVGIGEPSKGWTHIGMAAAIVQAMGLHISETDLTQSGGLDLSEEEQAQRTSAFWAFCTVDAHWSLMIGRDLLVPSIWSRPSPLSASKPPNHDELLQYHERHLAMLCRTASAELHAVGSDCSMTHASQKAYQHLGFELDTWHDTLPEIFQLPTQLHHVKECQPRLLLLHINHSLSVLLYYGRQLQSAPATSAYISQIGLNDVAARCEEAAMRIARLADCHSRTIGMHKAPIQLHHGLFTAGTTFLLLASKLPPTQKCLRQQYLARVQTLIAHLSKLGTTWSGATVVSEILTEIQTQSLASLQVTEGGRS